MSALPQHSYASFVRYEPFIAALISHYPQPAALDPSPLRPITFAHRLRDAINAFLQTPETWEARFTHEDVNRTFHIAGTSDGYIFTFTRSRVLALVPGFKGLSPLLGDITTISPTKTTQDASNQAVFEAFALLKNLNLLSGEITFLNVSPENLSLISSKFPNVELIPEGDSFIML